MRGGADLWSKLGSYLYWLLEHLFQFRLHCCRCSFGSWEEETPLETTTQDGGGAVINAQTDAVEDRPSRAGLPVREPRAEVTVLLPGALAGRAGNRTTVTASGRTIREVIAALDSAHPGLRFNLCHETGELRPFVNIFVNGVHVRYLQGIETPLTSGATLHVLPSVAGG